MDSGATYLERALHRRAGKQARAVERRQRRIRIIDDERNFGAAEGDSVTAGIGQALDRALEVRDRLRAELPHHEFG